ncbi:NAD(P)-binding protein [Lutimonas sp.]|uniref:NAD(P)-binding protein n=1 Tax=Lutimonas sp. TaxID=1872403 RepID=UPI003D9ADC9C
MKKTDEQLGMSKAIARRDFIQATGLASLAFMLPSGCVSKDKDSVPPLQEYPPIKTGMRGSHDGSFETAHALAREGKQFDNPVDLNEYYDLVVVGAGIRGLTAAYEYRKKFGSASKILILDNHDDFGGHAKRNEFNQSSHTRLSWGGTMNLEYTGFSTSVLDLIADLGIDVNSLHKKLDFHYGNDKPAIWFDEETFGKNILIPGFSVFSRNEDALDKIDQFPLSDAGIKALKDFYANDSNVLEGLTEAEIDEVLYKTSYTDFLDTYCKLPQEVIELFIKSTDGYWGVQTHSLSVAETLSAWLPGAHRLGDSAEKVIGNEESEDVAMFPDGNATIARLLVCSLIPEVCPEATAKTIAMDKLDYSKLDASGKAINIRLSSTVVRVKNKDDKVEVSYVQEGKTWRIKSKHSVLACYHSIIPHICPELPSHQKKAQQYQVKHPMLLTNVLIKNSKALDQLGISGAYCPGRMHAKMFMTKGVETAGYAPDFEKDEAVALMFWGMMEPPERDVHIHDQLRKARMSLFEKKFEDFEREVREVLDGLLGPAGFDVNSDILAITVNRWSHGYSYGYLDLWDEEYKAGEAPHEIARQPIGNISIANCDAAASAYTQSAIEEAFRAVDELG